MPTFANTQVHVTPQTLTTSLSLDEIAAILVRHAPQGSTHSSGWRGVSDDLDKPIISDDPGTLPPQILAAEPAYGLPERIAARRIWWEQRPLENAAPGTPDPWFKEGLDVLISRHGSNYLLVWTTNLPRLINDTSKQLAGSGVAALLSALRTQDSSADISNKSPLTFAREAYLWLTNAVELKKDIGGGVKVTRVAGMGTDELNGRQRRSNRLDGEVNLARTSFLSAIGSDAELGPAEIRFTDKGPSGRIEHTAARLNVTAEAKLLTSECRYEAMLAGAFKRQRAAERLVYRYLPLVRDGFKSDATWGATERDRLILEKQVLLVKDFRRRAKANPQYAAWVAEGGDIDAD